MTVTGVHPNRTHRRTRKPKRDVLAALSAAATLVTLVVGVPLALIATTGWPWPAHMPTADQIGRDLLQPDDGHLLAAVLVGIAWIAWLLFTSGVVIETVGHARGSLPRRLPVISPMQQLVAPLVAAVAVLLHAPAAPMAFAASPGTGTHLVEARPIGAAIPTRPQATATTPSQPHHRPAHQRGLRLYVVQPPHNGARDMLWSIAAKHLGDPLRWHEIADLNRGRPQPDGERLTDPHWIRPGWRLLMPADATDLPLAEPEHRVAPQHAHPSPAEPEPRRAHTSEQRGVAHPPAAPHGREHSPSPDRARDTLPNASDSEPALPVGLAVLGVLAAGLLTILGRRRAVQRRHRRTGEDIRKPPPDAVSTEIRLRVAADPPAADTVTETLRALATVKPEQAEHVRAAELTEHGLELLLDQASEPPAPFVAAADNSRWRLDRTGVDPSDAHSALPALASIGHRDGRLLFVDLERVHTLFLTGDTAAADWLLSWITADLAAGAWATTVNLTLVGVAPPLAVLDSERIRHFDQLTPDVVATVESHSREFATTEHVDTLATRTGDPLEPWPVEVVLVGSAAASSTDAELLNRLTRSGGSRRNGLAIVIAGEQGDCGTVAVLQGGRIRIPALSIDAQAAQLTDDQVSNIGRLIEAADDLDSQPARPDDACTVPYPVERQAAPAPEATISEAPSADDDLDAKVDAYLAADSTALRIQLLGPVTVKGPGELEQKRLPTCTELIVYLACSPHGATLSDVDEALWPERLVPKQTRNNTIYRARAWAGQADNDQPRLSRVDGNDRVHLRDALVDWQLFERLVARARTHQGADMIRDLRKALSLVHGKPFESIPPGRYGWLAGRNLEEHMTAVIIDTAHCLAGELLAAGDAGAARDVARTAQTVDRHDERAWRDLFRAEAALGRPRKVREHVRSMMRMLDVEVADELMPETAQLISQLLESEPKLATG